MFPAASARRTFKGWPADPMQFWDHICYCRNLGNVHKTQIAGGRIERCLMHGHGVSHQWLRQHRSPDRCPYLECLIRPTANMDVFSSCFETKGARWAPILDWIFRVFLDRDEIDEISLDTGHSPGNVPVGPSDQGWDAWQGQP